MSRYAFAPVTLAPGASHTFTGRSLRECRRHTLQVTGAGTATLSGRMVRATADAVIQADMAAGLYSGLEADNMASFTVTNSGAAAIAVILAGGL